MEKMIGFPALFRSTCITDTVRNSIYIYIDRKQVVRNSFEVRGADKIVVLESFEPTAIGLLLPSFLVL